MRHKSDQLKFGGTYKVINLPLSSLDQKTSISQYYKEVKMSDLGLDFGKVYAFYIRIVDEKGNEIKKVSLITVDTTKKQESKSSINVPDIQLSKEADRAIQFIIKSNQ